MWDFREFIEDETHITFGKALNYILDDRPFKALKDNIHFGKTIKSSDPNTSLLKPNKEFPFNEENTLKAFRFFLDNFPFEEDQTNGNLNIVPLNKKLKIVIFFNWLKNNTKRIQKFIRINIKEWNQILQEMEDVIDNLTPNESTPMAMDELKKEIAELKAEIAELQEDDGRKTRYLPERIKILEGALKLVDSLDPEIFHKSSGKLNASQLATNVEDCKINLGINKKTKFDTIKKHITNALRESKN